MKTMRLAAAAMVMAAVVSARGADTPATAPAKTLVIVKAVYGDLPSGDKSDVTDKVKAMVKDNELSVDATNDNFDDPASGKIKKLQVDYTVDGVKKSKLVPERSTMLISPNAPEPTKLIIKKAVYGDLKGGKTVDVTDLLKGIEVKEAVTITVTSDSFSDPAPDAPEKSLKVDYVLNGVEKSVTVKDGDELNLKAE